MNKEKEGKVPSKTHIEPSTQGEKEEKNKKEKKRHQRKREKEIKKVLQA